MSVRDKLFYALLGTVRELESILLALNAEKMPHDGDEFHERLNAAKRVLAEAEAVKQEPDKLDSTAIMQAVARGWCHPINAAKVMDSDLALAIAAEVSAVIDAAKEAKP